MKLQILLFALVGVIAAAPANLDLINQFVNIGIGKYLKEGSDNQKMLVMKLLSNVNQETTGTNNLSNK